MTLESHLRMCDYCHRFAEDQECARRYLRAVADDGRVYWPSHRAYRPYYMCLDCQEREKALQDEQEAHHADNG